MTRSLLNLKNFKILIVNLLYWRTKNTFFLIVNMIKRYIKDKIKLIFSIKTSYTLRLNVQVYEYGGKSIINICRDGVYHSAVDGRKMT